MNAVSRRRRPSLVNTQANQRRHRPDYILLLLSIILMAIGLIVVYAISPGLSASTNTSEQYYISKQIIAVLLGFVAFGCLSYLPVSTLKLVQKPLIIAALVSALGIRLFGEEVNGAYRWIQFGGFSFQAVELIKFALLIWLAGFLTERVREGSLDDYQKSIKPLLLTLGGIGVVVAFLQSDLGSSVVAVAILVSMTFVAGIPLKRVVYIGGLLAMGVTVLIASSSYRVDRLKTFLNPNQDCQGIGYQACQSHISIGSGGLAGLGLGRSIQAYGYQPEAANDSIFAILAEKFGFIGSVTVIGLYVALFARLRRIIERTSDMFSRLLVTGILAWLSTQALINIGAMIGLLPLKGITLPFISYGGTSILFVMAAIGVAFQISRYTTYSTISESETKGAAYGYRPNGRWNRRPYYANIGRR